MNSCIVVIDDEAEILSMLEDLLEMEGFSVVAVSHPDVLEESIAAVEPSLFLIDIMLPRTSGIEVAAQLRRNGFTQTPMVAMSASRLMSHLASESGVFTETLDKPFDIVTVLDCVQRLVSHETPRGGAFARSAAEFEPYY